MMFFGEMNRTLATTLSRGSVLNPFETTVKKMAQVGCFDFMLSSESI